MPANWLHVEAQFPAFDGDETTEEKLAQLQNYLYMLVEQMRYTMQNLDMSNLNQNALMGWENAITQPLYLMLEGESDRITAISATADGLTAMVQSQQQEMEELSQRVDLTMTSDQIAIAIEKRLENGVDQVTTKTGFTFNEDGMTVSKSGSEMTTQITEDGMTVNRSGTQVLVANNQGVQATNLHANTYLIIGGKARFEKYGDNRIGCFWIGG